MKILSALLCIVIFGAVCLAKETSTNNFSQYTGLDFCNDFQCGYDENKQWAGGTETMAMVSHQGKLFASMGYWNDTSPGNDPVPGAQVLVKDSCYSRWKVDVTFGNQYRRVDAMKSVTFSTDYRGVKLMKPVSLLVASPTEIGKRWGGNHFIVYIRNDQTGKWIFKEVSDKATAARSFGSYTDSKSGISYIFAGTTNGMIFKGAYDSDSPDLIKWDIAPELSGTGRVMCFAKSGSLYAACGLRNEEKNSGGLFRRIDGNEPKWTQIYRWDYFEKVTKNGDETKIMRGLTSVIEEDGTNLLIGTRAFPGVIEVIKNDEVKTELDIRKYFTDVFGVEKYSGPALSAYNSVELFNDPSSGKTVGLIGAWVRSPSKNDLGAYFLVRFPGGKYQFGYVPKLTNNGKKLRGIRTICNSPFPEEKDKVLYFGGFDGFGGPHHNTAWIYKATIKKTN
ncbi:MAG: hypothetical protein HQM08_16525 [Candidatus Riflebacteria bacterium]|nr:hypothetical protein [Candidatus Riflebacteria bacterium]